MGLKINILIFVIFMLLASSGVGKGSLAFIAVDPDPYNIPVGHVAFGFQQDDGKIVFGSFGPDGLETQIFDDLSAFKNYLSASDYKSFEAIHVEDINPNAANEMMTTLKDSGFVAIQSAYPIGMSNIIMPGTENCLTFAIKVLKAYGADMPAIIPLVTSWPRAYYDGLSKLGWIESGLDNPLSSKLAQAGIETPLLPSPASGTSSGDYNGGTDVSDIGPITGSTTPSNPSTVTNPPTTTKPPTIWLPPGIDWVYNPSDGKYYGTWGGSYWKYDPDAKAMVSSRYLLPGWPGYKDQWLPSGIEWGYNPSDGKYYGIWGGGYWKYDPDTKTMTSSPYPFPEVEASAAAGVGPLV